MTKAEEKKLLESLERLADALEYIVERLRNEEL